MKKINIKEYKNKIEKLKNQYFKELNEISKKIKKEIYQESSIKKIQEEELFIFNIEEVNNGKPLIIKFNFKISNLNKEDRIDYIIFYNYRDKTTQIEIKFKGDLSLKNKADQILEKIIKDLLNKKEIKDVLKKVVELKNRLNSLEEEYKDYLYKNKKLEENLEEKEIINYISTLNM